jgi:synaptobrevin family protein YKT6
VARGIHIFNFTNTMKLFAILITHTTTNNTVTLLLSTAFALHSTFAWYERSTVESFIKFFTRTITSRITPNTRQTIIHEQYSLHVLIRSSDGLGCVIVTDDEYPCQAALTGIQTLLRQFTDLYPDQPWLNIDDKDDMEYPFPEMKRIAIKEWQDPTNADKLLKIHSDLDKTITSVRHTIEQVLDRGIVLDQLVADSTDLNIQAKLFYAKAAEVNRCKCIVM